MTKKSVADARQAIDTLGVETRFRNLGEELKMSREKRGNIVRDLREITDKAEAEKRDLTNDEVKLHERLMGEAQRWGGKVEALEEEMDASLRRATAEIEQRESAREIGTGAGPVFETRDGKKIRGLLPSESMASRVELPDGIRAGDLDIGRALRGILSANWKGAEAELRVMSGSGSTVGGYMLPEPLSANVIDLARNQARVFQAGAITIPMPHGKLGIARVTGDPSASWRPENTTIPASGLTFGRYDMRARTLAALCKMSVELWEDAPNLGDLVANSIGQALALELDRVCLRGQGAASEPLGIRYDDDAQEIDLGTDGDYVGYDDFSRAWQKVQEQNGPGEGLSVILAPRTLGDLDRLKDGEGLPMRPPASWEKMAKFGTNQVPTNLTHGAISDASEAYIGDFSQLWVGMTTGLKIEVTSVGADGSSSAFSDMQVWVRAYLRADTVFARPERFVRMLGIKPQA